MDEIKGCGCREDCRENMRGCIISPQAYMKVISHPLRKRILHKLFTMTLGGPVTKDNIAKEVGMDYEKVNYQLNEHLREFWVVKQREKVRGAYREYIAPEASNTVHINVGAGMTIYIIDPLADVFGKLKEVGTRCDRCGRSADAKRKCADVFSGQGCWNVTKSERTRWEKVLLENNRKPPFMPVDYMIVCTAAKSLDGDYCTLNLGKCDCVFATKKQ